MSEHGVVYTSEPPESQGSERNFSVRVPFGGVLSTVEEAVELVGGFCMGLRELSGFLLRRFFVMEFTPWSWAFPGLTFPLLVELCVSVPVGREEEPVAELLLSKKGSKQSTAQYFESFTSGLNCSAETKVGTEVA